MNNAETIVSLLSELGPQSGSMLQKRGGMTRSYKNTLHRMCKSGAIEKFEGENPDSGLDWQRGICPLYRLVDAELYGIKKPIRAGELPAYLERAKAALERRGYKIVGPPK